MTPLKTTESHNFWLAGYALETESHILLNILLRPSKPEHGSLATEQNVNILWATIL